MDSRIYILTHKRLTGQLSSVENEELLQLSLLPENKALSEEIAYLWNLSKNYFPVKDWQKDAAKEAFMQRIRAAEASDQGSGSNLSFRSTNDILLVVAIILLSALFITYYAIGIP